MIIKRFAGIAPALLVLLCTSAHLIADDSYTAKAKLAAIPVRDKFTFIVLGDTRSPAPIIQPPMFKRAIQEINLLRPTFAIDVGDLIRGYTNDRDLLIKMWDEFVRVTSEFQVPFFPVAGNHDIKDELSQELYVQYMGELYYSFDYGESHFIALNSDMAGFSGKISSEQFEWLKNDLAANSKAKNIFVFLHKPLYYQNRDNWNPIHELLKQYNTRVVFQGDVHQYRKQVIDGIRYIITGGGGAEIGRNRETGDFHHYTCVTVDGEDVRLAIIKPGGIENEDIVTVESRDRHWRLQNSFYVSAIVMPRPGEKAPVQVTVSNKLDQPLVGRLEWDVAPDSWTVEPAESAYSVEPGKTAALGFALTLNAQPAGAKKPPEFRTIHKYMPDRVAEVRKQLSVLTPQAPGVYEYAALKVGDKIEVDGSIDDWSPLAARWMEPEHVSPAAGQEWNGEQDLSASFRCAWDTRYFYVAAEVQDDEFSQEFAGVDAWKGDALRVGIDVQWVGGHIYDEFTMALTKSGPQVYCNQGSRKGRLVTDAPLKIVRGEGTTVYEAALPWGLLSPLGPLPGASVLFNVMAFDTDASGRKGMIQWAGGIGSSRPDISKFGALTLKVSD